MTEPDNEEFPELDEATRKQIEEEARREVEELLKSEELIKEIELSALSEAGIDELDPEFEKELREALAAETGQIIEESSHLAADVIDHPEKANQFNSEVNLDLDFDLELDALDELDPDKLIQVPPTPTAEPAGTSTAPSQPAAPPQAAPPQAAPPQAAPPPPAESAKVKSQQEAAPSHTPQQTKPSDAKAAKVERAKALAKAKAKKAAIAKVAEATRKKVHEHQQESAVIDELRQDIEKKSKKLVPIVVGIGFALMALIIAGILIVFNMQKQAPPQVKQKKVTKYVDSQGQEISAQEAEASKIFREVMSISRRRATYTLIIEGLKKLETIKTKYPDFYNKYKQQIDKKEEVLKKWKVKFETLGGGNGTNQ